jgi:hypothetical protein
MGRLLAPDDRDQLFRARQMQTRRMGEAPKLRKHRIFLPAAPPFRWRDQGSRSSCTEHAAANKLCGWPNPRPLASLPFAQHKLYERAQELDEWPGSETVAPFYEGSSGRAVCRAMRELGLITEWWNAFTVDELRRLILADTTDWATAGPVTMGINWYDSMFTTDAKGFVTIGARARVSGGHQICIIGANDNSETFYLINSWVTMRLFRMSYATARRLLEREDGDAQFFVEVPLNPVRTMENPMEGVLDFGMSARETPTLSGAPMRGLRLGTPPEEVIRAREWLDATDRRIAWAV